MKRTNSSVSPSLDVLEPRCLLSSGALLESRGALTVDVREIKGIVTALARTNDTVQASTELTELSSQVPSASPRLALAWQIDLGLFSPHSHRSMVATERRLIADLYRDIPSGGESGNAPVSGPGSTTSNTPTQGTGGGSYPGTSQNPGQGSTGTPNPPATPSLDSVRIQNTTGLAIVVTIQLEVPQVRQPTITETISAQGDTTALFDFGSATGDFMMMNVSLAPGGGQSPPPFDNVNLSQPMNGYNGTLYTISLFGPYFNVSIP